MPDEYTKPARKTTYNGHTYDSMNEAYHAALFDLFGWTFVPHPLGMTNQWYEPDMWIDGYRGGMLVECKCEPDPPPSITTMDGMFFSARKKAQQSNPIHPVVLFRGGESVLRDGQFGVVLCNAGHRAYGADVALGVCRRCEGFTWYSAMAPEATDEGSPCGRCGLIGFHNELSVGSMPGLTEMRKRFEQVHDRQRFTDYWQSWAVEFMWDRAKEVVRSSLPQEEPQVVVVVPRTKTQAEEAEA